MRDAVRFQQVSFFSICAGDTCSLHIRGDAPTKRQTPPPRLGAGEFACRLTQREWLCGNKLAVEGVLVFILTNWESLN